MTQLIIKEIGPIKDIAIELKRINIFIGPQSCGKSTIAKIISFCQWVEKEALLRQNVEFINNGFVITSLLQFHNITDFFNPDSEIIYTSDVISLHIKGYHQDHFDIIEISKNNGFFQAVVSKNAYIPADRNLAFVTGILSIDLPKNYFRSFLVDWDNIRRKFGNSDKVRLLDIGESYYYNENTGLDTLHMKNGKDLPISQASSGIQSVTPLYLYLTYLTNWIYTHDEDKSVEKIRMIKKGALRKFLNMETSDIEVLEATGEDKDNAINALLEKIETRFPGLQKHLAQYEEQVGKPHFSNIVIEEPEQNLFPQTQARLIYDILSMLNHKRDSLVITTHSPFILYALNNCMLAHTALDRISNEIKLNLDFQEVSYLDPKQVAVWEIREGYIENIDGERNVTIQNTLGLIGSNYFDRVMGNIMADYHNLL